MNVKSATMVMAMAFTLASGACSSSKPAGTGAGGGNSGAGGGEACTSVVACGGSVVGTWTVTSSCLTVSGQLNLGDYGVGCPTAAVTGSLRVTGTLTLNANHTYQDGTTTTGTERFSLAPSCLVISSTQTDCEGAASIIKSLGYDSLTCTPVAGGGCDCAGTVNQTGSIGVPSVAPSTSDAYSTSGNELTLSGDIGDTKYAYCTSANTLTITPQGMSPLMSGTIVLQKSDGGGSGGAGGSAGAGAAAGSGGTGGRGGSPGTGGSGAGGATGTGGGGSGAVTGPCDIYKAAGNPCVAAHSTVRALFGAYSGKLYQVRNSAGATKDILTIAPGGAADGLAQDTFCTGTTCVTTVLYDQSGHANDLWYQGSTMVPGSPVSLPARATTEPLMLNGHKVYSLYINPHNSYWVDASKSGIALRAEPEGLYMVTSGKHSNSGCCFDYGNSETDRSADGAGTMDAINLSSTTAWGRGVAPGPWVMADLEFGLFSHGGDQTNRLNSMDPAQTNTYVTAILKNNGTTEFALRGGDAQSGPLSTYYKGILPSGGWSPMRKQGAIVLGSGGDCCKPSGGANDSEGTFYEGCIVTGYPTDATEDMVQANVVAAGYGK